MRKKSPKIKINHGRFNGEIYAKYLDLNKAVLWKDRQLSIPQFVYMGIQAHKCTEMRFIDRNKGEMWVFDVQKVMMLGVWKQEGQEKQFYFPIESAKKVPVAKVEGQND